jgi:hypothetical protein
MGCDVPLGRCALEQAHPLAPFPMTTGGRVEPPSAFDPPSAAAPPDPPVDASSPAQRAPLAPASLHVPKVAHAATQLASQLTPFVPAGHASGPFTSDSRKSGVAQPASFAKSARGENASSNPSKCCDAQT